MCECGKSVYYRVQGLGFRVIALGFMAMVLSNTDS